MAVLNKFWLHTSREIRVWWAIIVLLMMGGSCLAQQSAPSKEYQVKAAFIFNFAQFVDWPPDAFTNASAPLSIGILGTDPFGGYLDSTIKGEKVGGHPLVIQRYHHAEEIQDCQVLFVSRSEAGRMGQILATLKGRSILTIGEADGFCKDGGIIRFVMKQNKIHFRISPEAAKNSNLTVSSKLLRLAEIVQPGGD